ncbi:MAG TPA: NAD(P)H-dependent oxidoreductase [Candidatus Dormibacteraeota bacterium]|nr:NAD(P)H-dependent oxidoreductase [Candidatus Dormibacteraeota bacterium]
MPSRNVGVIVGSLRKDSYTRKIARALMAMAPPTLSLSFIEIGDLPLYNPDLEGESGPKAWAEFRQRIRDAGALLFFTPEHNRGMPAAMKNAIDVGSRPPGQNTWGGKPAGTVSVTPGGFGAMASHHQLRQSLAAVGVAVMPSPEMYIAHVNTVLGEDGSVTNEKTRDQLQKFLNAFVVWVERFPVEAKAGTGAGAGVAR